MENRILLTGACGQVGSELTIHLRSIYGKEHVIATDIQRPTEIISDGPFEYLDVLDETRLAEMVDYYNIDQIYHLATLLSAKAEQNISHGWKLNVGGLLNVLEVAKEYNLEQIFWPSSIAVFGPDAPKKNTDQRVPLNPTTVYGISKMAGEQWCAYYHNNFGVDVRSLRYPGLIGHKSLPGGGTTDYAIDIHYKALQHKSFWCYLKKDSYMPMMYMKDAIQATIKLMQVEKRKVGIRTSYNLSAISFSPSEIAEVIRRQIPDFEIQYKTDYRQKIADSWPDSIDDTPARQDWGWKHQYELGNIVDDMLKHLSKKLDVPFISGIKM